MKIRTKVKSNILLTNFLAMKIDSLGMPYFGKTSISHSFDWLDNSGGWANVADVVVAVGGDAVVGLL